MYSYQREREDFLITAARVGLDVQRARVLMRHATTLHRLAEADCSGYWPCDNGERKVIPCSRCEAQYVPSVVRRGLCPACRTRDAVCRRLDRTAYQPYFQGDPRGPTFLLFPRGTSQEDMASRRVQSLYVPARSTRPQ